MTGANRPAPSGSIVMLEAYAGPAPNNASAKLAPKIANFVLIVPPEISPSDPSLRETGVLCAKALQSGGHSRRTKKPSDFSVLAAGRARKVCRREDYRLHAR